MSGALFSEQQHCVSVHVRSCVLLEGGSSNVGSSFNKGWTIVSHRKELILELCAYGTPEREHVVAIGLELQPHGSV